MKLVTCETKNGLGLPCPERAQWLVAVGTRKADAQLSCARHLSRTCWLMTEAEEPRREIALTVTPVRVVPLIEPPEGGW